MGTKVIIGLASDHAGYTLKNEIHKHLTALGYPIEDFGTYQEESCDYPDFAHKLGVAIEQYKVNVGISICGSGVGISIVLNKYPHVRAALAWNKDIARLSREHNDANVLSLPARFISTDEALSMVDIFLSTKFQAGRHQLRVDKIPIRQD